MPPLLALPLCLLFGYLVGTLNPAYFIGRLRGLDIRKVGSGNAGASNATIVFGMKAGVFTAIFDIVKAAAVTLLAPYLFPALVYAAELAGSACILGHIFPFYMHFRGGKGLACLGGVVLAIRPRLFLVLLPLAVIAVFCIGYICVAPLGASLLFPLCYGLATARWPGALFYAVAGVAILLRHRENLRRIRLGTELRIDYLFHKERELARIKAAMAALAEASGEETDAVDAAFEAENAVSEGESTQK